MKPWLLVFFLFIYVPWASGQEAVELILAELEGEMEVDELGTLLTERLAHPLDINKASEEELLELPYFDAFFVRNLLLERSRRGGRFRSIYELKDVQGAPLQQLPLLEPFIIAGTKEQEELRPRLEQELFGGLEGKIPIRRDQYRGVGWGARYAGKLGEKHQWSMVLGKDRGEPRSVDYLSASYRYQGTKWHLVVGDYKVGAGLGVHLGQNLSYFSSADLMGQAPTVAHKVLRPHSSFREYGFLRGVGMGVDLGALEIVAFGGTELVDARTESSRVITLYPGGMHRTPIELARRHSTQRATIGAVVSYRIKDMEVGGTAMMQKYLSPRFEQMIAPTKHQQLKSASLYFQYQRGAWRVAGESLLSRRHQLSSLLAMSYYNDRLGTMSLLGYYTGNQYFSPYGWSRGKQGIQAVWSGELARWWRGMLYLSYSDKGWGTTARAEYRHNRHAFQGRIRHANQRTTLRMTHQYKANQQLSLRTGLNLSRMAWGLFIRGQWHLDQGLRAEGGLQYFQTQGAVIRADQPYMPWRYYAPMLRGKGIRATVQVRYSVQAIQVNLRASHTYHQEEPPTPLPSLLELSTVIKL